MIYLHPLVLRTVLNTSSISVSFSVNLYWGHIVATSPNCSRIMPLLYLNLRHGNSRSLWSYLKRCWERRRFALIDKLFSYIIWISCLLLGTTARLFVGWLLLYVPVDFLAHIRIHLCSAYTYHTLLYQKLLSFVVARFWGFTTTTILWDFCSINNSFFVFAASSVFIVWL